MLECMVLNTKCIPTPTLWPLVILANNVKRALIEFTIFLRRDAHVGPICGWLASSPRYLFVLASPALHLHQPFVRQTNALGTQDGSLMCLRLLKM